MTVKTTKKATYFPSTDWERLDSLSKTHDLEHGIVLGEIMGRYWKPLYYYVLRCGFPPENAQDIVQSFLLSGIEKRLFEKGNPVQGRFRSLLLSSLNNFLSNEHRSQSTQKRSPQEGIISLDQISALDNYDKFVKHNDNPEAIFHRSWISELILRTLVALDSEFRGSGKSVHCEIFRIRIVDPALKGIEPLSIKDLAKSFNLTEKEVANRLITARRAFQRLLRLEIKSYIDSEEEASEEINDIFRFLASPK
jgi:DNA-directed RNA polymerase specialized sigma24 family protein